MNLASLVSAPAFSEPLILRRMLPGRRDDAGKSIPNVFLASAVDGVVLPVEGEERLVLPEGLRGLNITRFLILETASDLSGTGDIIEHGGKLFRVQTVKKWEGFWEVLATSGNTGALEL